MRIGVHQMFLDGGKVEGANHDHLLPATGTRGLEYLTGMAGEETPTKGLSRDAFSERLCFTGAYEKLMTQLTF
mgnify:CR=1 FL=1|jgi:hypothetical protein